MFIAYNLRRIGNILTREMLKEYLRILASLFLAISDLLIGISGVWGRRGAQSNEMSIINRLSLKPA
jgi:hypothetical protein